MLSLVAFDNFSGGTWTGSRQIFSAQALSMHVLLVIASRLAADIERSFRSELRDLAQISEIRLQTFSKLPDSVRSTERAGVAWGFVGYG
ncbi:MAG: hypothetical protein KF914_03050 [Rhizobiaceae bacterium]|nr:hypothetical protein [Rhizobiaceae bacterium]